MRRSGCFSFAPPPGRTLQDLPQLIQKGRLAEGVDGVSYAVKEGSELPLGLRLADGKIVGTPAAVGSFTFTIVASATNYDSVEAEFSISVAKGTLSYSGSALVDGVINDSYRRSIALAETVPGATYTVKEGSALPAGLEINGAFVQGTPSEAGDYSFIIVVKADGYEDAEATFTLKIASDSTAPDSAAPADSATPADSTTPANSTVEEKKGCGGMIGTGSLALLAIVGAAAIVLRKKKD